MTTLRRAGVTALILTVTAGCGRGPSRTVIVQCEPSAADHGHSTGPHDGPLVEWGGGVYHAELVVGPAAGEATVYVLGPDAKRPAPVAAERVLLSVRSPRVQVELRPTPLDGEPAGMASRFVGRDDRLGSFRGFEGTISGTVGGKPFAGDFKPTAEPASPGGPDPADAKEVALFLKPGGAYTPADIEANGRTVPSVRYKGFHASHDIKPKSGDQLCPVTLTKSSPKLTWVVGGKTYEFCCPPCLDEFVQQAKDQPETIKSPDEFRKK